MMKYTQYILVLILMGACSHTKEQTPGNVFYTCSMDPQVMEKQPGKCPICKMELTKIIIDKNDAQQGLRLSKEQEELANIHTMVIGEQVLGREKMLNARLAINENKRSRISSRVSGRIERLFVKNQGEVIKPGMVLYELFSEDLLTLQKEYILALEKSKQTVATDVDYAQLANGARNKLLLLGMNERQLNELIHTQTFSNRISIYSRASGVVIAVNALEGAYVMDGDVLFEIADLSTLWVEAELYASEVMDVTNNDPVVVRIDDFPGQSWNSTITFTSPQLVIQSKVNIIRAEIPNTNGLLKPGMQASVLLKEQTRKVLAIPAGAVLQDSHGSTVWIKKTDGTYEIRKVITGIQNNDMIEIRSGVRMGEELVINGAYLLNSEYIFKKGINPVETQDMSKM